MPPCRYNAPHVRPRDEGTARQAPGQPRLLPEEGGGPFPAGRAVSRTGHVRTTHPGGRAQARARRHRLGAAGGDPRHRSARPPVLPEHRAVSGGDHHAVVVRLTSGSTGRPRGILATAGQLLADARHITSAVGIRPADTIVCAIPLGHAYGFGHVLMSLVLQGSRPILLEQPLPALLLEALSGPGPLVFTGTPYLFSLLLQAAGRKKLKGLRLCLSAGAPLPAELSRACKDRLGLPIRTFYGASECGGVSYDRSRDGILPDGCVGTLLPGVNVTVRAERGGEDGAGRLCVESDVVALGYVPEGSPELSAGRFVTGDLGRIDAEGRLHLAGRADRMINVGGKKVNPVEVEAVLREVPGVRQVVVFGAPDRHRGQVVCACVVAARGVTREALLTACGPRLAPFKLPRRVEFLERIPVSTRGKTDRKTLLDILARPPDAPVRRPQSPRFTASPHTS